MKAILPISLIALALGGFSGAACAQSEQVLFSFLGGKQGGLPATNGNLLMLPKGQLIGTANGGGKAVNSGYGVVFEALPPTKKNPSWREKVIYRFPNTSGGYSPYDGLTLGANGVLYGETYLGGPGAGLGCGVVYQLTPPPKGGTWTESTIHYFQGGATSGCGPYNTQLLYDSSSGYLYGTTQGGGANNGGTLFQLSPNGGGSWTETVLYSFGSSQFDGTDPIGTISEDSNGVIYGTSETGGPFSAGVVWEYTTSTFQFDSLYYFQGGSDGATPTGGVIGPFLASPITQQFYLLATTSQGGGSTNCAGGCGTVVTINLEPVISETTDTILHAFQGTSDGYDPVAGISLIAGNFWGVARLGGNVTSDCTSGCGTIFEIQRSGTTHVILTYTPIYSFGGPPDGAYPETGLAGDSAGDVFGVTQWGGTNGASGDDHGTLWEYVP